MIMLIIELGYLKILNNENNCKMEFEFGMGVLDSQHYTVAFSSPMNLEIKKTDGEDLAGYTESANTG